MSPGQKTASSTGKRHRVLPPVYFIAALALAVLLHRYAPLVTLVPAPLDPAGAGIVIPGLALTLWAAGQFHVAGTPVIPFHQSTALVTSGVYRFTRNPMYLGMALVLLGAAVLLGSLAAFLPIPLFAWQIQRKFIVPEEAFLEDLFGQDYLRYKSRVGRWL